MCKSLTVPATVTIEVRMPPSVVLCWIKGQEKSRFYNEKLTVARGELL